MSQFLVIGGIAVAVLLLWRITKRIERRDREKHRQSAAMERENSELRHVVTEMAMEKHNSQDGVRRGH